MKKRTVAALLLVVALALPLSGLAASPQSNIIYADDMSYVIIDGVVYPYVPYKPQTPTPWQGPGYVSPDGSYYIKYPSYPYYYGYPYPQFINQQYGGTAPQTSAAEKPAGRASVGDVVWSTEYLYQVYVNNRSLDFRVFVDGEKVVFKLAFEKTEYGTLRMLLTVRNTSQNITLEMTKEAVDYLEAIGVAEATLTSGGGTQRYSISNLRSMAK